MAFLGNLRIKTISLLGNALLAGMAMACAGGAVFSISHISQSYSMTTENIVPSLFALSDVQKNVGQARLLMAKHILAGSVEETTASEAKLDAKIREVDAGLADYRNRGLISDATENAKFEMVQETWAKWKQASQPIRALSNALNTVAANEQFSGTLNPIGNSLTQALDAELAYNVTLSNAANKTANDAVDFSRWLSLTLGGVAGLVALGVILLMMHRVIRPLGGLASAMDDMAAGNLDRDTPCLDLTDEVGDIGRALDAIKHAIAMRAKAEGDARMAVQQEVVSGLAVGLTALREGRLAERIDRTFPPEYEVLRRDFNEALATLAGTIGEVTAAAQNVRVGAGQIASAASDLSGRTESQAAALEESAAAMRQLATTADAASRSAADANTSALEANREATASGDVMTQAVGAMEAISGSSARMEEIVALIDGIAFQTNLLALNAGVEAARAGEAGKGFAVVATEVRALAQRSAEAAKDIAGIIRSSGREVSNGVQMIGQTQSSLVRIVERTRQLAELMGEITRSAAEQSAAIRQVDTVVGEMDRITQANAALVEESTAASRSLSNEADGLGLLVEHFDLGHIGKRAAGAGWRDAA